MGSAEGDATLVAIQTLPKQALIAVIKIKGNIFKIGKKPIAYEICWQTVSLRPSA